MIAKSAIKNFLERELDSYNWMKKVPMRELQDELEHLPIDFDFKTNPRKAQLVCFLLGTAFEGFNFHLDMGVGKAQPLDRRVLTPTGYKLMGEIAVGDEICHPSGGTTTVEAIHPQGSIPVYEFVLSDGTSTQCCEDHLWALSKRLNESTTTLSTKDVALGLKNNDPELPTLLPLVEPINFKYENYPDYVTNQELADHFKCSLSEIKQITELVVSRDDVLSGTTFSCRDVEALLRNSTDPKIKAFSQDRDIDLSSLPYKLDAYVLGFMLGSADFRRALPQLEINDFDCVEPLEQGLGSDYKLTKTGPNRYDIDYDQDKYSSITSLLRYLNLNNSSVNNRSIPTCYKLGSVADRLAVAQGLIDSAGTLSRVGTADFVHESKSLRDGLSFILQSLGCVTRTEEWTTRGEPRYYLIINPPSNIILSKSKSKIDRLKPNRVNTPVRKVSRVVPMGKKVSQCITVSADDGLYVTEECIVTHNTKLTLDLYSYYKKLGKVRRGIIVVPNTGNVEGWREEVEIHSDLTMSGLIGNTPKQRFKALNEPSDLCVINYHGLMSMMTQLKPKDMKKAAEGRSRKTDRKMVHDFVTQFDFVAFDEIHKAKDKDSLITHLCDLLATNCDYKYGLTGTPMNKPEDLWSQFYLIDGGETLSEDYDLFKAAFFKKQQSAMGSEWVFDPKMRRQLTRLIQNKSIRYRDYECQDLPKTVKVRVPVVLSKRAREAYIETQKTMVDNEGDRQVTENSYIKQREITAGYTSIVDPDTGEKIFIDFPENPKLEILMELVDQMPHDSKMIVFHQYKHTGQIISDALKEAKINHRRLNGSTKDKPKIIRDFKEDPTIHVLIASETGTTGHNFQVANYTVFYETFTPPITRRQADKRTHRGGQKKTCYYYDLCAKNSVDEKIYRCLQEGIDLSKLILEGSTAKGILY